jgi:hypothetical protein
MRGQYRTFDEWRLLFPKWPFLNYYYQVGHHLLGTYSGMSDLAFLDNEYNAILSFVKIIIPYNNPKPLPV